MDPQTRELLRASARAGGHAGLIPRDDAHLATTVAEWAAGSLREGGGAVLVGTAAHLERIRAQLGVVGVDISAAERSGHAVLIEADWLLAKFMIDGTADGARFRPLLDEVVDRIVARVGSPARVRAWGEMVSLLHAGGNAAAARALESFWERALQERGFSLLCTYDPPLGQPVSAELLADLRASHVHWHVGSPAL